MLVGFLLPLLRRLSSRAQALVGAAAIAVGLALTAAWAGLGAGHGAVLPIRSGFLLALVGAILCVRAGAVTRRKKGARQEIEKDDLAAVDDHLDTTRPASSVPPFSSSAIACAALPAHTAHSQQKRAEPAALGHDRSIVATRGCDSR